MTEQLSKKTGDETKDSGFVELFGKTLQKHGDKGLESVNTASVLKDKVVGIYFSAHWCGPCRSFTPDLIKAYKEHSSKKNFEVVFASSDSDKKSFESYYKDMPWLALDFDDRDLKNTLSKKYGVQGIPTLVILDSDGTVITSQGRMKVGKDPQFKDFPWRPIPVKECLKSVFTDNKNMDKEANFDNSEKKTIGLYFSAHWCGPCRSFTPDLAAFYKKMKEKNKPFEIIFCSSDSDEKSFKEYFKEMPWMALPYKYRTQKEALSERYGIRGIPSLVILDENFELITDNGRSIPKSDPEGKKFPWLPEAVNPLSSPAGIDESPSMVIFMENEKDQEKIEEVVKAVAEPYLVRPPKPTKFRFFTEKTSSPIGKRVRSLTGLEDEKKLTIILLDLEDKGGFYKFDGKDVTEKSLKKFLEDYMGKTLTRQQCKQN